MASYACCHRRHLILLTRSCLSAVSSAHFLHQRLQQESGAIMKRVFTLSLIVGFLVSGIQLEIHARGGGGGGRGGGGGGGGARAGGGFSPSAAPARTAPSVAARPSPGGGGARPAGG